MFVASARKAVFSAGGDLRELYATAAAVPRKTAPRGVRVFLERIHAVLNAIDAAHLSRSAAVQVPVSGEDSNWPWPAT